MVMQRPIWEGSTDASKMFFDVEDDDGNVGKAMMRIIRSYVVVTTAFGEKVAFTKTNRGNTYLDSRLSERSTKADQWGDKKTTKKRARLSESEVVSELERLLDDRWEAQQAFRTLQC